MNYVKTIRNEEEFFDEQSNFQSGEDLEIPEIVDEFL